MKSVSRVALSAVLALASAGAFADSSFKETWSIVKQGPYSTLPEYHTTYDSLFDDNVNILAIAADRTLDTRDDTLPWFQKLVHPVGICFSGTWTVDTENQYSGYFAKGSKGLIIARASEALGNGETGDYRAFGLAGKIFATTDATSSDVVSTANFFTLDDLGGTLADSFLDETKTNWPKTSIHLSQLAIFPMLTKIASTFQAADDKPSTRQVYEIAELGLAHGATATTPYSMALVSENSERVETVDFRQELRVANYAEGLNFGIYVSSGSAWTRIGQVHLTEDALSDGCDHRLHFHHPRWK